MPFRTPRFAPLVLLLSQACSESTTGPNDASADAGGLRATVEDRLESAAEAGFSGAVAVTASGERLLTGGYGFADRKRELPNSEQIAFDAGSIQKTATAIAIYALEEGGRVSLSDPLDQLFPEVPADKGGITLRDLVQHRAGLHEYHDTEGDFEPLTRHEARERIFAQELLFEPGSDESYSNSGYTLLADVIEEASGVPFTEYVRETVFDVAGMNRSGFYSEALWQSVETAIGYGASTFGDNDPATWPYTWALVGNGGLVTTVEDLDRFAQALWDGDLLGPAALESFYTDVLDPNAIEVSGTAVYGQAGAGDFGLGAVVVDAPERGVRIILTTNAYDDFDVEGFAGELTLLLLD